MIPRLSYSLAEAAAATGLSERHLRAEIKAGRLRTKKSSTDKKGEPVGRLVILVSALQDYIDGLPDA